MSLASCVAKLNSGKAELFSEADVAEIMSAARRQKGALDARQLAAVQSLLDEAIAERAEIAELIAAELPPAEVVKPPVDLPVEVVKPPIQSRAAEATAGQLGSREKPHTVPMRYNALNADLRTDLRDKYPKGASMSQLIADGVRTGTTRYPQEGVKPGHFIKFPGVDGVFRRRDDGLAFQYVAGLLLVVGPGKF